VGGSQSAPASFKRGFAIGKGEERKAALCGKLRGGVGGGGVLGNREIMTRGKQAGKAILYEKKTSGEDYSRVSRSGGGVGGATFFRKRNRH